MPPRESQKDRIEADLRRRIGAGREFPPGSKLPSTSQLAAEYREKFNDPTMSQGPVQDAVDRLKWDGIVVGKQGVGVFVASPSDDPA